MKNLLIIILSSILILGGCFNKADLELKRGRVNHPSTFVSYYDLERFTATNIPKVEQARIRAGVVPHHLLAGDYIASFFQELSLTQPEVVIIVGPNHYNKGARIITGYYGWETPNGIVETDESIVGELIRTGLAVIDEDVLADEHAVGNLIPFVGFYLPQTRIVPLILHHNVSLSEINQLLTVLKDSLKENVVLVASVDFSHYLTRREAEDRDIITLEVIKKYDYTTLFTLGNDHLDSPASLAMIMRLAQIEGDTELVVKAHTNSGLMLRNDFIETTSYFVLQYELTDK